MALLSPRASFPGSTEMDHTCACGSRSWPWTNDDGRSSLSGTSAAWRTGGACFLRTWVMSFSQGSAKMTPSHKPSEAYYFNKRKSHLRVFRCFKRNKYNRLQQRLNLMCLLVVKLILHIMCLHMCTFLLYMHIS